MAYDEYLVERIRQILHEKKTSFKEKKMMGVFCFMVQGKMCVGANMDKNTGRSRLMARVGKQVYDQVLLKKGCSEFNFTGRALKGYVYVSDEAIDLQEDLEYWVQLCLNFNPLAKSTKKK